MITKISSFLEFTFLEFIMKILELKVVENVDLKRWKFAPQLTLKL